MHNSGLWRYVYQYSVIHVQIREKGSSHLFIVILYTLCLEVKPNETTRRKQSIPDIPYQYTTNIGHQEPHIFPKRELI